MIPLSRLKKFHKEKLSRLDKKIRILLCVLIAVSLSMIALGIVFHNSQSYQKPDAPSEITGKVVHAVYNGFSDPSSRFGTNATNFTFENDSDIVYMSVSINDYFIYNKAYVSFDGQDWLEFTLTPQGELKNDWIRTSAIAILGMNKNNMRLNTTKNESSENYIIVYTCSKPPIGSTQWDCHDGWQIINFKAILKKPPLPTQNQTNSTNSTGNVTTNTTANTTGNVTTNTTTNITANTTSNTTNSTNSTQSNQSSCACDFVISLSASEWQFNGTQKGVQAGDRICFSNGNRTGIGFVNIKGAPNNPVIITNMCNGSVNITAPSNWGNAITFDNSSYIRFTGGSNPNIFYGIKVRGATMGVNFQGLTSDFEIDHVNVSGVGSSGIVAKTDPTCNPATWRGSFTLRNGKIHDNYVSMTVDEGMYIGNSHYDGGVNKTCNGVNTPTPEHDVDGIHIYNNILRDIGNEGIQVGSTKNLVIHDNFVYNSGRLNHVQHQNGYQFGGGTEGALIYRNYLDTASGFCVLDGGGGNTYYNNIFINCNMSGIMLSDSPVNYAPSGFVIVNNIFINPGNEGVYMYSENTQMSYFYNNIIFTNRTTNSSGRTNFRYVVFNNAPASRWTQNNNIFTNNSNNVRFVNYASKDFHLQSSSPAIDTGLNGAVYGVTEDYDGVSRPRNSAYDIGAYEFTGTPAGSQPTGTDADSDGYNSSVDCNDTSASIWTLRNGYTDNDGDAYTTGSIQQICSGSSLPSGYSSSSSGTDCNDNSASVWILRTGYTDSDSDGYTTGASQQICSGNSLPAGYASSSSGTDCLDSNANVNPSRSEVCGNGLDDDCSGGDATCPAAPTCSDGLLNGNETGVDCGGAQCSACQSQNPTPALPSGALFSYPFTTNADDATGNGYNGVVTGATWTAQGSGGSYNFDGNDYITVSNANSLDGFTGLTIEVWTINPVLQDHEYLVSKRRDLDAPWSLYAHNSGYWTFAINGTSGVSTPVVLNKWNHIVATWNGTSSKIYINGTLMNTYNYITQMPSYPANNVLIGAREAGSNRVYFYQGTIGEVHVYNRPLTQTEITQRYDDTKGKYS